jgi:hypothetical protein
MTEPHAKPGFKQILRQIKNTNNYSVCKYGMVPSRLYIGKKPILNCVFRIAGQNLFLIYEFTDIIKWW